YRFVTVQALPVLKPSILQGKAEQMLPGQHAHSVQYNGSGKSAVVTFYEGSTQSYYLVYMDPYSGAVLKVKNMYRDFFFLVKMLHFCLLLPMSIGQPIVAVSTLIFLVMLLSGIVLWWPKNKSAVKQRFWFRWKENLKWKRKNYDLHNVLGFYVCWIALGFALTGLVWGFEWYRDAYYGVLSGGEKMVNYYEPSSDTTQASLQTMTSIDHIYDVVVKDSKGAKTIEVHVPETKSASIMCAINTEEGTIWKTDFRYFDQHTLKELSVNSLYGRIADANTADKIMRQTYDIHVGAIGGLAGKVLAFLASLICASLPVTGFLIWYGRNKKKKVKTLQTHVPKGAAASVGA
ncbi:MAG TPA: PepSY-associated TM helix domain-containing protein, partial [Cytophagales bacterium]|nr:PepSY-associated TM helix domain-containing protein [Cytophagales bacterium]